MMTNYNIEEVASELMFTTDELREIFEIYFDEAIHLVPDCHAALANQDYIKFSQIMHGFKGASSNLRMNELADLAEVLEKRGKIGGGAEMALELPEIQAAIDVLKKYVDDFYADSEQ